MLKCPADMQVSGIAHAWQAWRAVLDGEPAGVAFDASDLRTIDAAGLQMLAVITAELREKSIAWRWENCPRQLADAAAQLGLSEMLGTPP